MLCSSGFELYSRWVPLISLVPRRQEAFSFKINIYINTLIRFQKINSCQFLQNYTDKDKKKIFVVGRNKLRIIQSNLR